MYHISKSSTTIMMPWASGGSRWLSDWHEPPHRAVDSTRRPFWKAFPQRFSRDGFWRISGSESCREPV